MLLDAIEGLLPAQRELVTHRGGPLLAVGGAGCGKTTSLLARFEDRVSGGSRPEQLAFLVPSRGRSELIRLTLETALEGAYEQLFVLTPPELAGQVLGLGADELRSSLLNPGERAAMLLERIDELSLEHHDFAGSAAALVAGLVRRIDRLKAENVSAEDHAAWARSLPEGERGRRELEFSQLFRSHERMLAEAAAMDEGGLIARALRSLRGGRTATTFIEVLVDDAQELDLAAAMLVREVADDALIAAGDPAQALRRFRGAGASRIRSLASGAARVIALEEGLRTPQRIARVARALLPRSAPPAVDLVTRDGAMEFWRCAGDRAQAQSVAADVERLISRHAVAPGRVAVLVPSLVREGQALAVALEERAIPHRLVGEAAFFQRAEIRDLLAWLRLLANPADAPAVVRALARPPVQLRSIDIARCTQIARRRKLDMVSALAAALEAPQVPPEARERVRVFLKLHRAAAEAIDTVRPDLYVHRLIDRLGLRRQQLYAAQADVVERLRALAEFSELAAAYVRRVPQGSAREFARQIAAVAEAGLREQEEPELGHARGVQILPLEAAGGLEVDHIYILGLHAGVVGLVPEDVPAELLREGLPADDEESRHRTLRQALYVALTRARERVVVSYSAAGERGTAMKPSPLAEELREAAEEEWQLREEELFGPGETLQATYRMLRDELLEGTLRAGGRLSELRFDTDLDITHAVVRYLELLKVAALIARPEGQELQEALRDVNARILQAVTSEQREVFTSSELDAFLLDEEQSLRRRVAAMAARDEPSLEAFLPRRGEGVVLSASDIDTYRTCPLKYKFARVFRIPQEPTLHQRFGIVVHQVLERFHGRSESSGGLPELLGLLDTGWRRGGFGDSEEERQLRGKAAAALARYHQRFSSEEAEPVWFERQFTFRLGPHLLRGRVDRVDRLPGGEYELIDYKTGRPRSEAQLLEDVQLSLYAMGAREAWSLPTTRQAYLYLLDDRKVSVPGDDLTRTEWITEIAADVGAGILSQDFEPTPSFAACSLCDYRLICPAAER